MQKLKTPKILHGVKQLSANNEEKSMKCFCVKALGHFNYLQRTFLLYFINFAAPLSRQKVESWFEEY